MPFSVRLSLLAVIVLAAPAVAGAQSTCSFAPSGAVLLLVSDCITEKTIEIPDGMTLDGNGHSITAVDPPGAFFEGAIIWARGRRASIIRTRITAALQSNVCGDGEQRLRGIYFDGASGEIGLNTVESIHRIPSACEEGNAIEVRSREPDDMARVTIRGNIINRYQKSGIVVYGGVEALIEYNFVGKSAGSGMLAPNGIQVGPVAAARVQHNQIRGDFVGVANAAGSAVLVMTSGAGTVIELNDFRGDAEVGINVVADQVTVANNTLEDTGANERYDVGIVNLGLNNEYFNNAIAGFRTRQYGVDESSPPTRRGQQVE